jgi:hypothetical protein
LVCRLLAVGLEEVFEVFRQQRVAVDPTERAEEDPRGEVVVFAEASTKDFNSVFPFDVS